MKRSTVWIKKSIVLFLWLLIWQGVHWYVGKDILIPSPFSTLEAGVGLLTTTVFYQHVGYTLYRVCIGILVSLGLGITTGILANFIEGFALFISPLITALKATPVMAVIMIALLWFNSHQVPIFVGVLMCYPIVHTQLITGLQSVDQSLLEVAKVYCVKKRYVIKDIYLAHLKPYLQTTLTMITGMAWKVIVAAEVLSVPKYAMGYNLLMAKSFLEVETLFAWVIIIVILSSWCEKLVQRGVKKW